ncbi:hypothetical protein IHQ72_33315 [Mesorhizobium onobrychidis]|uniref:Electron transfer flavoprotein alpha/beta-subunit N-terminal domain-containing protein n=1 Tax=Mesorhizobium onobrychidis TaxID=2775404 RepID=A0ABY5QXA1_9HYPH|nr:hypothetical protein IHQ72_33315 [Mesorhizobium onobrychidis]
MAILLIAEHDNATLADQNTKALSAALQIGSDVHALVAGKGAKGAADAAARLNGVSKVLLAEADELTARLAEPLAALVISIAGAYDTIIAPATASGKNVAPRLAALLDDAEVSDVISPDTFKRPIYARKCHPDGAVSTHAKKVITVRTASHPSASQGNAAAVENISAAANPRLSIFIQKKLSETEPCQQTLRRSCRHQQGRGGPIFEVVGYGLVGDLFVILRKISSRLAAISKAGSLHGPSSYIWRGGSCSTGTKRSYSQLN